MTVIVISMKGAICYGKNVNTLKSLKSFTGCGISYNLSVGFECFLLYSVVFIILFTAPDIPVLTVSPGIEVRGHLLMRQRRVRGNHS